MIWTRSVPRKSGARLALSILWLLSARTCLGAAKDHTSPNPGFVTEFAAPAESVLQALQEVLHDQTIHGTQIFDREATLTGAIVVPSTSLFPPWKGEDRVFYVSGTDAIHARHFLDTPDRGTHPA